MAKTFVRYARNCGDASFRHHSWTSGRRRASPGSGRKAARRRSGRGDLQMWAITGDATRAVAFRIMQEYPI